MLFSCQLFDVLVPILYNYSFWLIPPPIYFLKYQFNACPLSINFQLSSQFFLFSSSSLSTSLCFIYMTDVWNVLSHCNAPSILHLYCSTSVPCLLSCCCLPHFFLHSPLLSLDIFLKIPHCLFSSFTNILLQIHCTPSPPTRPWKSWQRFCIVAESLELCSYM